MTLKSSWGDLTYIIVNASQEHKIPKPCAKEALEILNDLSNRFAGRGEEDTIDHGKLEENEDGTDTTGDRAVSESTLDIQGTNKEVTGEGTDGHGKTLPSTSNETLSSGSQTLRSHIGSDTGSRRNDKGRVDTLQPFQSIDGVQNPGFGNGIRNFTSRDHGVTEHTKNTGSVSDNEDPVDTEELTDFLGEEVEESFRDDTVHNGSRNDLLIVQKFFSNEGRLISGDESTNETGNEDGTQEEGEAGAGH